jgi:hypothetical protein
MVKHWPGRVASLLCLAASLAGSLAAQQTWTSSEEFRGEYVKLLDTLAQRIPSSDESVWAVELRRKVADLRQQVSGMSYPMLDQFQKLTDRQSFTRIMQGLEAGQRSPVKEPISARASLVGGAQPLGVIAAPNYSSAVAGTTCSTSATSAGTIDGEKIGLYVDRGLSIIGDVACESLVVILGEGTNIPACVAFGITKAVEVVLDSLIDHQEFCNGLLDGAKADVVLDDVVDIHNDVEATDVHLTNVNNQITGEFTATNTHITNVDNHITNVDNHIAAEFTALDTHLVALFTQLTGQISEATALLNADLRQVMKLELTPEGVRKIVPAILTCTGANCPNVLAACPAAGCSWNLVGPLP